MKLTRREIIGAMAGSAIPLIGRATEPGIIRIVVPFSAGQGSDVAARSLAQAITTTSGRNVVIENKPGAGGSIGSLDVAKSKPDGSSLLYNTGGFTTNPALMKKLPFDPVADFTPITRVSTSPGFALLVSSQSPYKTLKQFVDGAKAGKLSYGSSGVGNTTHIIAELFCRTAGVEILHIPYKGQPINELLGGQVDCTFIAPSTALPLIQSGKVRALGLSGAVRSPALPDTPTFEESGFKVPDVPAWSGLWGPPNMSEATVKPLYELIVRAGQEPSYRQFVRDSGGSVDMMSPREFKNYADTEIARYKKILPPLGIEI